MYWNDLRNSSALRSPAWIINRDQGSVNNLSPRADAVTLAWLRLVELMAGEEGGSGGSLFRLGLLLLLLLPLLNELNYVIANWNWGAAESRVERMPRRNEWTAKQTE